MSSERLMYVQFTSSIFGDFCGTSLESSSVFWKSGQNFNPKQLTNLIMADYNFTENFTADFPVGIFQNV